MKRLVCGTCGQGSSKFGKFTSHDSLDRHCIFVGHSHGPLEEDNDA